jgi:hypothetical protein
MTPSWTRRQAASGVTGPPGTQSGSVEQGCRVQTRPSSEVVTVGGPEQASGKQANCVFDFSLGFICLEKDMKDGGRGEKGNLHHRP